MFFDRISNSFALARSSWQVLWQNKKLVLFPIFSGIGFVLVLASFLTPLLIAATNQGFLDQFKDADGDFTLPIWVYPVVFAFYFCNYFVIIFCNSALISCALMHFNGEEPTLGDGFRAAVARLPQILAWALVAATVGFLLKLIECTHRRVGEIISAILGTAWTVMTYFVVPVIVVEKVGPFKAVGRSLSLLRQAWGEALIGHFGLGFFKLLLALPMFLLFGLGGYLCSVNGLLPVGLGLIGAGAVYFLLFLAVSSALETIFLAALYQFAAFNQTPQGFDEDVMAGAFRQR